MKTKSVEMTLLFDLYGELLTEKQQQLFDFYYNEDLSLAEIAELLKISRQGVRDGIVRAETLLKSFDKALSLSKTLEESAKIAALAEQILARTNDEEIRRLSDEIIILTQLQGGNHGI